MIEDETFGKMYIDEDTKTITYSPTHENTHNKDDLLQLLKDSQTGVQVEDIDDTLHLSAGGYRGPHCRSSYHQSL